MKNYILLSLLLSLNTFAATITVPNDLHCASMVNKYSKAIALSCVSKASIAKDLLEVEKLKLEIKKLQKEETNNIVPGKQAKKNKTSRISDRRCDSKGLCKIIDSEV